jgi:hypothetical protein
MYLGLAMSKNPSEMKAHIDNPENWVDEYGDFLYRVSKLNGSVLIHEHFLRGAGQLGRSP